jgi:hypothetical protein
VSHLRASGPLLVAPAILGNTRVQGSSEHRHALPRTRNRVGFHSQAVRDEATFTNPHRASSGIDYVFVNGTLAVEQGKVTGCRAGRVLRRR